MDYLRESFWRGYAYRSLSQANADVAAWIAETAHQRIHGIYRIRVPGTPHLIETSILEFRGHQEGRAEQ